MYLKFIWGEQIFIITLYEKLIHSEIMFCFLINTFFFLNVVVISHLVVVLRTVLAPVFAHPVISRIRVLHMSNAKSLEKLRWKLFLCEY
jgi:hypothetical protein